MASVGRRQILLRQLSQKSREREISGEAGREHDLRHSQVWPERYIVCTVCDRILGNFPAKNAVYTPPYIWVWPTLAIYGKEDKGWRGRRWVEADTLLMSVFR